jgi:AcrR family transcriptional regulator
VTRARKVDHRTRVGLERSARTETRILEAALRVFAERGPDAPVIDEFVQAAGIARGTFYNYFDSVEALLRATSEWTTRELVESIEHALADLEGPTLRFGVGLRLFFAYAQRDPLWSRFVARVWFVGGLELPLRDIGDGIRRGHFRVPGGDAAHDLVFGGLREALRRIGAGRVPPAFGDQVAATCLQALGADPARIAAALAHPLPAISGRGQQREGDDARARRAARGATARTT